VTGVPSSYEVDTSEATHTAAESCGVATVWYEFTPTQDTRVRFDASSSAFDPLIALYTGDPANLVQQRCMAFPARIYSDVTAGVTYYVSVGTYAWVEPGQPGPGGNVVFSVDPAGPRLTTFSMTVNGTGTVNRAGVATVSGTVTCDQPAQAQVGVYLAQRFNRNLAQGYGYADVSCGPEPTGWSAQVSTSSGTLFGSGNATLQAYGQAWDEQESYLFAGPIDRSIKLNRR
jgi:hypothetical protein